MELPIDVKCKCVSLDNNFVETGNYPVGSNAFVVESDRDFVGADFLLVVANGRNVGSDFLPVGTNAEPGGGPWTFSSSQIMEINTHITAAGLKNIKNHEMK